MLRLLGWSAFAFATPALLAQPAPRKAEVLWQKLEAEVAREVQAVNGVMGVVIVDLRTGRRLAIHGDEVFPTASTIKLAVLAELYRQSQEAGAIPATASGTAAIAPGRARLTDRYTLRAEDLVEDSFILGGLTPGVTQLTNRDLATCMVAVSDNAATNLLIDRVGAGAVNALLEGLGLKQTRLRRKMMDLKAAQEGRENTGTPAEFAALLEALHQGRVLNPAMTADFFSVLGTGKDSPLPRLLPEGVRVANKPGSLGGVRADVGLIFLPERPFIVCAMGAFLGDERSAEQTISRIARSAYRHFEALAVSSPLGRAMGPRTLN